MSRNVKINKVTSSEERRIFAARLEGWPRVPAVHPSFETAAHRNRLLPISTLRLAEVGQARLRWAASSEREKESNLGWRSRMTLRHRSPGGNFDSRLPHFGVEYCTCWGLATPSGESFTRSQDEVSEMRPP